jgi:dihydrofolate reductase
MIIGIVAISKNYAIGKDGKLPWHYSADLKFFKETTTGNAIVMGSNTWRSIGKPLPNRVNIVLTRSGQVETPESVIRMRSASEVVEFSKSYDGDVFIIGGAGIYDSFAELVEKWIVTFIPKNIDDADTFIPENFLDAFELEQTIDLGDYLTAKKLRRR